jgi:tryptophan synthase alpha chain
MNRITRLFQTKSRNILSVYFTSGYPALNDTRTIITELDKSGADLIEIGIPFSDPVADGKVIQRSSEIALRNGMSVRLLFEQLAGIREKTDIPLILMGYINPIYKFGIQNFLEKCSEIGIDGAIIPDLPVDEYVELYEPLFKKHGILNIFLVTPQTTIERIEYLDSISEGFLYLVSSSATTGSTNSFDDSQIARLGKFNHLILKAPRLIGFGISDNKTFNQACSVANGAIIGSSFIRAIEKEGTLRENIHQFVREIRNL